MFIESNPLRCYSCTSLVPAYEQSLREEGSEAAREILKKPLVFLRMKVAEMVEELFLEKKERTLLIGCMHHSKESAEQFVQTQTVAADLLPQKFCEGEDHGHANAVTIDIRRNSSVPLDLSLDTGRSYLVPSLAPLMTDFAKRDAGKVSDIEDFEFVKDIKKIYVERLPHIEKGPSDKNLPLFRALHKLLGAEGVLAFDFCPYFNLIANGKPVESLVDKTLDTKKEVSQKEIDDFITSSPYSPFFSAKKMPSDLSPSLACQNHNGHTESFCPTVQSNIARSALRLIAAQKETSEKLDKARQEVVKRPQADLRRDEVGILIGDDINLLEDLEKGITIKEIHTTAIFILCHPRKKHEIESLLHQMECYRVLNVNPSLQNQISEKTKQVLDSAFTTLVEKVIFPQLKLLGFEKVAFNANGQNPENKRLFERVVYVRKI